MSGTGSEDSSTLTIKELLNQIEDEVHRNATRNLAIYICDQTAGEAGESVMSLSDRFTHWLDDNDLSITLEELPEAWHQFELFLAEVDARD